MRLPKRRARTRIRSLTLALEKKKLLASILPLQAGLRLLQQRGYALCQKNQMLWRRLEAVQIGHRIG